VSDPDSTTPPLRSARLAQLCEACGYEIDGLEEQSRCPECGRDLSESDPARRRVGSAWQRAIRSYHAGLRRAIVLLPAAAFTAASVLWAPARTMRAVRIERRGMRAMTLANITIAATILTAPTHASIREFVLDLWPAALPSPAAVFGPTLRAAFTVLTLAMWFALLVSLTRIERFGVVFFSKRRAWRVTPTVALVVTAHASFLWIAAAMMAVLAPPFVAWVSAEAPLEVARYLIGTKVIAGPLGFIAGMTWFELTTFLGVRACRFANEPRD
jgi:predicted RNA-binding Zn-ribbon protein involved in translation (DUF1610 family)